MSEKIELIISGKIINKKLIINNKTNYQYQINQFQENQEVDVIIRERKNQRSKNMNAYWHAVCFPIIGELMGETSAEAKAICKAKFILPRVKEDPMTGAELVIQRGSSELDSSEGWKFTQAIMSLAHFLNGHIPTPCESGYFCGRRECDICFSQIKDNLENEKYHTPI